MSVPLRLPQFVTLVMNDIKEEFHLLCGFLSLTSVDIEDGTGGVVCSRIKGTYNVIVKVMFKKCPLVIERLILIRQS